MIYNAISPTFSIPDAKQYFEISSDNGSSYSSASIISFDYLDITKMSNYTTQTNPLYLKFRKKSGVTDPGNYRITKILVNEASTFNTSNYGTNVTGHGTQPAESSYLAGKYVTYNNATDGGANFTDFKIQSIQNTNIQMVFYVKPLSGLTINFRSGGSASNNGVTLTPSFVSGSGYRTVHVDDVIVFSTQASFTWPSNWQDISYGFEYGITKSDVFGNTSLPANPSQTGAYEWRITVSDLVWSADPEIVVGPISFWASGRVATSDRELSVSGRGIYELVNNVWTWTSQSANGTYVVYEYTDDNGVTKWRIKDYPGGPASRYGFDKLWNDNPTIYYRDESASWSIYG